MKLFILLFLISCGKIKVDDTKHKLRVDAETKSYIIVRLDFIKEIKQLCNDVYPVYENSNEETRTKLVSQCTLDKMSIVDIEAINEFSNKVCENPVTEQEIDICRILQ